MVSSFRKWFGKDSRTGTQRVLEWNHDRHPGVLWRYPDPGSRVQKEDKRTAEDEGRKREEDERAIERGEKEIDSFQVKIGERAVALINNEFYNDSPPGIYPLEGEDKKRLEIIWVDSGQFKVQWGLPGTIYTKDNQYIGAHGHNIMRIVDPRSFVLNIVSSKRTYTTEGLNTFIKGYVADIIKQHLSSYNALDGSLDRNRDIFIIPP